MNKRAGEIEDAHEYTFDWAFADSKTGFPEWLRGDHGLFWITGKPGSGKSTLMKYLFRDHRTKQLLSENGRQILAITSFFFHSRGVETEKSFDGLLRSILYQLISQVPELVDCVADIYLEWEEQGLECPWSLNQLEMALKNMRQLAINGCIFLFIDALDEYSGSREHIARFIQSLALPVDAAANEKLKLRVCASSRPETTFISLLKGTPTFTLQDWTKGDIRRFADDRLKGCDRSDTDAILERITSEANGVFLWVKLVLDELWQPLCDMMSVENALSLLSNLPMHLPLFYEQMAKKISADNWPVFMALLELVLWLDYVNREDLNAVTAFYLAIEILQKKDQVKPRDISLTKDDDERRRSEMERRIKACSGGLIEITSTSRIQFVHQTVKSFIQDPQNRAIFNGKSTRDIVLAGTQRIMRLDILLLGKMDST
jgi:NACHT domain